MREGHQDQSPGLTESPLCQPGNAMRGGPQGSAATAHTLGALYTGAAPSIRLIFCQVKCASGSPGQRPCPDDALGNGHTVTQQLPTIVTFHLLHCRAATLSGQERTGGCSVPSSPGACPEQYKGRGVRKQHSHSSPESPRPAAASTDPGMKTLLLTLGLSLLAALRAQTLPVGDEETQDASGTWYLKATAADKEIPWKKLESVSVTPMTIKTLAGGHLEVTFTVLIGGQCREISTVLEKTAEPGRYTAHGGKHVVQVLKSQDEDHYILYCEGDMHGQQIRMAKLVGRYPEVNVDALQEFEQVAAARGLNADSIFIPKQREACSPGSD
ncbi:von Ebner gland protein 1-like isoform X2 [Marmota flaviventris]